MPSGAGQMVQLMRESSSPRGPLVPSTAAVTSLQLSLLASASTAHSLCTM